MTNFLSRIGLTRDSALWLAGIIGSVIVGIAAIDESVWQTLHLPMALLPYLAWFRLTALVIGIGSGKLSFSPLAQSGQLGIHADPAKTLTTFTGSAKLPTVLLALVLLGSSACASANVKAEKIVRQSIQASEDNRCTVHPQPCLSDDQFKKVNAELFKVAKAGEAYTSVVRAKTAKPGDALAFAAAVESGLQSVAILDPTGTISGLLAKLNGVLNAAGVK